MHSDWSRDNKPGLKKAPNAVPIVLALGLHHDVRPSLEDAAASFGLRVLCVRHLQAACAALASQQVAVVLADENTRPWDREVLLEHTARLGIGIVWVEAELAHDFMRDVLHMFVTSRGRTPHWRGAVHAS